MVKILGICGSPRKGNTEFMLRTILDSAKKSGAKTELILLRNLKIKHCNGCGVCEKTKSCVINDDMKKIYPKIFSADILVFGSPSYFDNVSGLMKDFLDRFDPIWEDKRLSKKKAVLVASGCVTAKASIDALKTFCDICKIKVIKSVYVNVKNDIKKNKKLIAKLRKIGKDVVGARNGKR